ncbi:MAG TPA: hypothetical protein VGN26_23820 [Armatimonadota bacterium]
MSYDRHLCLTRPIVRAAAVLLLLLRMQPALAIPAPGTIVSVAGRGTIGHSGDGGPALSAELNRPAGLAIDARGRVVLVDSYNQCLRAFPPRGIISALPALPGVPLSLSARADGLVVGLESFQVVRVDPQGAISVLAGSGQWGTAGNGGLATEAELSRVTHLSQGPGGELLLSNLESRSVRRVDAQGRIQRVAGTGQLRMGSWIPNDSGGVPAVDQDIGGVHGLAASPAGGFAFTDGRLVQHVSPDGLLVSMTSLLGTPEADTEGLPATQVAVLSPGGLVYDSAGNLFMSDEMMHNVYEIDAQGLFHPIAGAGPVSIFDMSYIGGYSGDGGPALTAHLNLHRGLAIDWCGNLLIADSENQRIRKVHGVAAPGLLAGQPLPALRGDVDLDGALSIGDVGPALRVLVGLDQPNELPRRARDVNADGRFTVMDVVALLRTLAGI